MKNYVYSVTKYCTDRGISPFKLPKEMINLDGLPCTMYVDWKVEEKNWAPWQEGWLSSN